MKKILLTCFSLSSMMIFAQTPHKIVACGGKFEYNVTQYQDKATIGTILSENGNTPIYVPFDTIQVESVQKIAVSSIEDGYIFLAAQDSIIQYQAIDNEYDKIQNINQIPFAGIKTIAANEDYLVAGKWYGAGDYLAVYEANTMDFLFASPTIKTEIKDILIVQDTLALVSYNLLGTIDDCFPYECFLDSIGKIDVIDLKNQQTIKTIDLGENGKGNIYLQKNYVGGFNSLSVDNQYFSYFDRTFSLVFDSLNTGMVKLLTYNTFLNYDGIYALSKKDSIEAWHPYGVNGGFEKMQGQSKYVSPVFNILRQESDDDFTLTETDYSTYGKVIFGNETVNTGISPEDVATVNLKSILTGLENKVENETIDLDNLTALNFDELVIFDLKGLEVFSTKNKEEININHLPTGVYILHYVAGNEVKRAKSYKK
jgi:hypothetical protein